MEASAERYARWKAPAQDGQTLIWPEPAELLADAQATHRRLAAADSALIQQIPLPDVRRRMRQWLGHEDERILVATGHQTELHHPGVWAKNALIDSVASKLGGRAFHFAVDTDEPKHLMLKWPGGSVSLTDDLLTTQKPWSGLLAPPVPAHLGHIEQTFARAASGWSFTSLIPDFLTSVRRKSLGASNLPQVLTDCFHELDWGLGLRYDAMIVSPICFSEPYLVLVHHMLARAGEFGADYNTSLEQYRKENKISTSGRPMPNLKLDSQTCEVPFWLDSLASETRSRASVERSGDQWSLRSPAGDEFRFDPAAEGWDAAGRLMLWLRRSGLRLSPRALTLTAVLRLLVADQFVHGIGGGQYDQVLDTLIAKHFGIEPPRFSVTTSTLYFPEATNQPRVCLPCLLHEGHRLKHGILGDNKIKLVEQISALPRRSRERSSLYHEMHDKLSSAWNSPRGRKWDADFLAAEERLNQERVLFDRELFYAIQPRDRLESLIEQYRSQFK